MASGGRVQFDFDGSLQLARQLWALGNDVSSRRWDRRRNSNTARAQWKGPLRTNATGFDTREEEEFEDAREIASQLWDDARNWAEAWAAALDQQNKNNRIAEVERISSERGALEKLNDNINPLASDDSHDKVPMPEPPEVPRPPDFAPTATEITY